MCHSLIKPYLFRAKWDILMRAKWDHPVVHDMHVILSLKHIKNAIYFDNKPVSVNRLI